MSWRGAWFRAQITEIVFSSLVWLVVAGLSLPAAAAALAAGAVYLVGRNTGAGLWWRFGARPATWFERDLVLAAIVPISSLRGRHQPTIWIGRRISHGDAVMATPKQLLVSSALMRRIATGHLGDLQVSVLVCQALGQQPVNRSAVVAAVDAYCAPWAMVTILVGAFNRVASRMPLLASSWKSRWIVFAAAIIDNARSARWNALVAVAIIAALSGTTPYFRAHWSATLRNLGDERARAEGLGPTLAAMIRSSAGSVRDLEAGRLAQPFGRPDHTQPARGRCRDAHSHQRQALRRQ